MTFSLRFFCILGIIFGLPAVAQEETSAPPLEPISVQGENIDGMDSFNDSSGENIPQDDHGNLDLTVVEETEAKLDEVSDDASLLAEQGHTSDSSLSYSISADSSGEFSPTPFQAILPEEIQSDGAFRYRFPIQMPQFKGFEPQLALTYNSSQKGYAGDGPVLGLGWTVSGLSEIRRVSIGGGIASFIDTHDVFMLDGQELLACADSGATAPYSGIYPESHLTSNTSSSCAAGGQFVTLIDDGRRVVQTTDEKGHLAFEVTNRDGIISVYRSVGSLSGQVPSGISAIISGPSNGISYEYSANDIPFGRVFLVSEIRDQQVIPNSVRISYDIDADNGFAAVPSSIVYAGYSIDFH